MNLLWSRIRKSALANSHRVALAAKFGREQMKYGELLAQVERLSAEISAMEANPLALCCDNGPDWVIADLACLAVDQCIVPLPTFFTTSQIKHALTDAGVIQVLTDNPALFETMGYAVSPCQLAGTDLYLLECAQKSSVALPEGTQKITYTSGSTGNPKGVCLGVQQVFAVTSAIDAVLNESISRHLSVLPLSTLLENIAGVYMGLLRGAEIHVPELDELGLSGSSGIDPGQFLRAVEGIRPDSLILVPALLNVLLGGVAQGWQAPESLKFVAIGGGKVSPALINQAMHAGLPVFEGYGLSECASVVSLNTAEVNRPGSVGQVLPHIKVEIDEGEIVIHGNTFLGYCGQDAPPARQFRTGDLGYLDASGFLYVTGRKKDVLITSFGRNISPEWIEAELSRLSGIRMSMVVGEGRPFCAALLMVSPGVSDASIAAALQHLNRKLPDYAMILRWCRTGEDFSVANGALTSNGRLRRSIINQIYFEQIDALYLEPVAEPVAQGRQSQIQHMEQEEVS